MPEPTNSDKFAPGSLVRNDDPMIADLFDAGRLLGPARIVLDRCAEQVDGFAQEAAAMAQRIVDLIGHSVTDEPPHALVELDELRTKVAELEAENTGVLVQNAKFEIIVENLRDERDQYRSEAEVLARSEAARVQVLQARLALVEPIVRRLASLPFPVYDCDEDARCGHCRTILPADTRDWDKHGWHTVECVWRNAREVIDG